MKYGRTIVNSLVIGTIDQDALIVPLLKQMVDDARGKSVIDIGCGSGFYSRLFANLGARVVGIDRNGLQLQQAIGREENDRLGIDYRLCHAQELLDSETFDIALCMFLLVDTDTVEAVETLLSTVSRLLKNCGQLLLVDLHPHNLNRENDFEYCRSKHGKSYFDNGSEAWSQTRLRDGKRIVFNPNYHYRLDFLFNLMVHNNLYLYRFFEPKGPPPFPTHMLISARKDDRREAAAKDGQDAYA